MVGLKYLPVVESIRTLIYQTRILTPDLYYIKHACLQVYTFGCNDEGSLGRLVEEEEECFVPGKVSFIRTDTIPMKVKFQ